MKIVSGTRAGAFPALVITIGGDPILISSDPVVSANG